MKTLLACSFVIAAAAQLGAQQLAVAKVADTKVALDAIVAVVNDVPITRYDLDEMILTKIQRGEIKAPADSAAGMEVRRGVLDDMIQDELIIQKAKDLKIDVPDADVAPAVDRQVKDVRAKYSSEAEFRAALSGAALGSPEEYRKFLMDQYRRQVTREKVIRKLTQDGKIIPINVTDAEISAEYEKSKEFIPKKPASVTFKQIVIAPAPTPKAKEVARVKAESLLAQLKAGSDFEKLAKRESMDLLTKETGGDIGWTRRDQNIPEYNRWLFGSQFQAPLSPGDLSPVVETPYGYFIIRVDRVQPGEVKAHQILIRPLVDSTDIANTKKLADSVAVLLKAGTPFDSLAKKYHDYAGKEETSILTPFERDSLPVTYQQAFLLRKAGDVSVFQIPGSAQNPTVPKFVVAQLLSVDEGGDRTLNDMRAYVRADLAQRGGLRRYIDGLRKQAYVAVTLDASDKAVKAGR
ncbi:MAG: peptidylprolyl isomerase [Gemmatimonadaceae bacterium]